MCGCGGEKGTVGTGRAASPHVPWIHRLTSNEVVVVEAEHHGDGEHKREEDRQRDRVDDYPGRRVGSLRNRTAWGYVGGRGWACVRASVRA